MTKEWNRKRPEPTNEIARKNTNNTSRGNSRVAEDLAVQATETTGEKRDENTDRNSDRWVLSIHAKLRRVTYGRTLDSLKDIRVQRALHDDGKLQRAQHESPETSDEHVQEGAAKSHWTDQRREPKGDKASRPEAIDRLAFQYSHEFFRRFTCTHLVMHHAAVDSVHSVKAPESKAAATSQEVGLGGLCLRVAKADDDEVWEMNKLGIDLKYTCSCNELGLDAVRGGTKGHETASKFHYKLLAVENS